MIIDTHLHLADLQEKTITTDMAIVPAIKYEDWQKIINLSQENKKIIPSFGIHPWYINQSPNNWHEKLDQLLSKMPNAIIGETGLDRLKDKEYNPQNDSFKEHIKLAIKHNRSIIIHAIKSNQWLEEYWQELSLTRFVFHSYNSKIELLNKVIKNGGYISFSASILNNKNKEKIIKAVPIEKILIETDAPYQKGDIKETAKQISSILNIEYDYFLKTVYENTLRFLNKSL